ncbi:hypothetical protein DSO57_1032944 [Entomophthora muscae]|uniref:Uncharacterized protein n=1 Tax=Entomophthora muscae TaxID=34485 RepID=A0ACC2T0G5_9FUNG|nr:hypothetical protein DSO57_1032944 [Entomophthora muscae]
MQISLNPNGTLVLESIASEDQDKVALYKLLLSDFHPFVTSRLQASHFVRERFITINGITTEMPHHILEKGDKVLASFGWRELFKSRIEKFYEAAEPTAFDTLSLSNHHAPAEDCNHLVGSKQGRILVTWKPPGVSPLHVRESVFYRECLERDFDSAQEVLDLFLDYFSNNPCGIKGTDLLYNVEKTIGGLCVVLVSQDDRMAKMINSSKVVRCYHAMCHGRLTEEVQNQLEGQGVKVDQESLRCNEGAICSSSDLLTEFRFSTTALSCGTQIRSLFKESGTPLVGNAKHAVPLKNVSKRGVLLALIGVSFYNPIRKEFQRYEHPEPQKFNSQCIFYREAAFARKKQAKDVAEMEKAGFEDVDGLMLEELSNGKPVAYITGLKTFCGHEFHVDANTLIPRPSSEVLVQTVVEIYESQFKPHGKHNLKILDIGTGSGCILLSCLKAIPEAYGVGIDICSAALEVAKKNSTSLGLDNQCHFLLGDMTDPRLQASPGASIGDSFDIVVCNPPYLAAHRMNATHFLPLQFEPRVALFTSMVKTQGSKIPSPYLSLSKLDQQFLFDPNSTHPRLVIEVGKSIDSISLRNIFDPCWRFDGIRKDSYGFDRCWVWNPTKSNQHCC